MDRPNIPLNALRAFEAAARHLTLSKAAIELCVTQAALSHQDALDRAGVRPLVDAPRHEARRRAQLRSMHLTDQEFDDL